MYGLHKKTGGWPMKTKKWEAMVMSMRIVAAVALFGAFAVAPAYAVNQFKQDCLADGGTYHGPIVVCTNAGDPGATSCDCGCDDADTRWEECGGCFSPDTPILMADGSYRAVEQIKIGELLWNPVTRSGIPLKSLVIGPESKALIEIGYEGKTVKITTTHPVLTKAGIKSAEDLVIGDVIYDKDGKTHRLTVLKPVPITEGQYVVNVNLDMSQIKEDVFTQHFVAAGDIVVGDWTMQEDRIHQARKAAAVEGKTAQDGMAAKSAPVAAAKVSSSTK